MDLGNIVKYRRISGRYAMEIRKTPAEGKLTFYESEQETAKETVLICPGGGYSFLSPREGKPIADAFRAAGYHAAVLEYQLGQEVHGTGPLKELAWAVRELRTNPQWEGKAERVWVAGFSAGGHLAASLGVHWNCDKVIAPEDQQMSRPDGLILAYPVISMGDYGHPRSTARLTGGDPELMQFFSLEKQELSQVPPVFLWGTAEDEKVPVMNSLMFAQKLLKDGGSCEYHLFPHGKHGMSLATAEVESEEEDLHPDEHIAHWMNLCTEWMKKEND